MGVYGNWILKTWRRPQWWEGLANMVAFLFANSKLMNLWIRNHDHHLRSCLRLSSDPCVNIVEDHRCWAKLTFCPLLTRFKQCSTIDYLIAFAFNHNPRPLSFLNNSFKCIKLLAEPHFIYYRVELGDICWPNYVSLSYLDYDDLWPRLS